MDKDGLDEDFPCSICGKQVITDAIFCNSCELWVHQECNHLSQAEFQELADSGNSDPWSCIKCNLNALNHVQNSCEYFDISSFNSQNFDEKSLSFLHLNICSLDKHFDNFHTFLSEKINHNFKVIGITETRIKSNQVEYDIENYKPFHTPTEADAGGSSLYISKSLKPSGRDDLEKSLYVIKP